MRITAPLSIHAPVHTTVSLAKASRLAAEMAFAERGGTYGAGNPPTRSKPAAPALLYRGALMPPPGLRSAQPIHGGQR